MSIETQSSFRYGFEIDKSANVLYISDETGDYQIDLPTGAFCPEEYMDTLEKVLQAYQTMVGYLIEYDSVLCRIKISRVAGTFDALFATGGLNSDAIGSAAPALGFEPVDNLGVTEITSENQVGKRFTPQLYLQNFVDCEQNKELRQATKSESSSGDCCEILHCGIDQFFEFEIKAQTNIEQSHRFIRSTNGYDQIKDFLDWSICGKPVQFLPDCDDTDNIYKIKLDRTRGFRDGTGYNLTEMTRTLGCGYYRTGVMRWRVQEKPEGLGE